MVNCGKMILIQYFEMSDYLKNVTKLIPLEVRQCYRQLQSE